MKKTTTILLIAAAIVFFGIAGYTSAEGIETGEKGPLHEAIIDYVTDKLGITSEEFETRRTAGESMKEIADSLGIDTSQMVEMRNELREQLRVSGEELGITPFANRFENSYRQFGSSDNARGRLMHDGFMAGFHNGFMFESPFGEGLFHDSMIAAAAAYLDITVEELEAKIQDAGSMHEIFEALELDNTEISEIMTELKDAAIQQAVEEGKLTEEQAQEMQEKLESRGYGDGTLQFQDCHFSDDDNDGFPMIQQGKRSKGNGK